MHRSALVLVALSTFTLVAPRLSAAASTPITGTIECSAELIAEKSYHSRAGLKALDDGP